MSVQRVRVNSCCGNQAWTFVTEKALTRDVLARFKSQGWSCPPHYEKAGVFFVAKHGVRATCSFGRTKVNVVCNARDCHKSLDIFEKTLQDNLQGGNT